MSSPFFFHTKEFVYRNNDQSIFQFKSGGCSIYFSEIDRQLVSLPRSTFGSFILTEQSDQTEIDSLLIEILDYARERKCDSIEIKCYPEIFSPENSFIIKNALLKAGFSIKHNDITQVLFCNREFNLDATRKRRLSMCRNAGYTFEELKKDNLVQAYDLFLQSRNDKGYPITMQLNDFINAFATFPHHYFLNGVTDAGKLIAACVVVKINEDILYYFFAGDDLAYRKHSPSTFLIFNLFNEAAKNKYQLIDLGISTDRGILNKGLYDFKKSFGAIDSPKLTFEKKL